MDQVTGVAENTDMMGTIELIMRIQPELTHLVGVTDSVPTGLIHQREFEKLKDLYSERLQLISFASLTESEMVQRLQTLPETAALLHLSYFLGPDGNSYSSTEAVELVVSMTDLPVYTLWDWGLGPGSVGGLVTSGRQQGEEVAAMVLEYLKGTPISSIPVMKTSPNIPLFDYRALQKHQIEMDSLPKESILLYKPASLYEENKTLFWSVLTVLFLLTILVITLLFDIWRRKKLTRGMRESQKILKDTLDHIPIYVYWKDKENRILGCNKSFLQEFSDIREQSQKNSSEYLVPHFSEEEQRYIHSLERTVSETGKPLLFNEKRLKNIRGTDKVYHITIIPFTGEESPLEKIILMQDITERNEMEMQLKQAQKMESLGRMAGGIAHDFNNLLTAIMGAADLIARDPCNVEEKKQYLEMIFQTTDQAKDLIKGLLTYARKSEVEKKVIHMSSLISSTVKLLKRTVDKSIKIYIIEKDEGLTIKGDQAMLQSALLNLGINASDAIRKSGELCFVIERVKDFTPAQMNQHNIQEKTDYIRLRVMDNGEGIPKEHIERLFDPFFTTKDLGKGTGLGLSGVYGCVSSHDGFISVESEVGVGTDFQIYLPLIS